MSRQNIYENLSVSSVMPEALMVDMVDFLTKNTPYLLDDVKKKETFKTRFVGQNYISDIVHRLSVLGKEDLFALLRLPTKTASLREAVDMTFLPIDLLQYEDKYPKLEKSLKLFPMLKNKMVINITDITKNTGEFSDNSLFQYRLVRDLLSRSFYTSSGSAWLSPALVRYTAKVYSMTIAAGLARVFGLSPLVQNFIQTLFCAFYITKMTSPDIAPAFLKAQGKFMGLAESNDITQILSFTKDVLGHQTPLSLEDIFKVIDHYDHDQLKTNGISRLNRPILSLRFASLYPESHFAVIALEYPPYFLFLMMLVLSNVRIGLAFPMKQMNLLKEGHEVLESLLKSPTLFNNLTF